MSFYIRFAINTTKRLLTYRLNAFFKMINRLIFMAVQVCIWEIVYGYDKGFLIKTQFGTISLHEMISYTVMSHVMYGFIQSYSINTINNSIGNGNISQLIIRPYSLKVYLFVETICESLVSAIFQSVPLLFFGILVYKIQTPKVFDLFLFILFLINGFFIYYLITTIAASCAFWVIQTGPINALVSGLIKIFSGVWIPVWFFSGFVLKVSGILPLKSIYFLPIAVYLHKVNEIELVNSYLFQLFWIIILFLLMDFIWKKGIKNVSIQGG